MSPETQRMSAAVLYGKEQLRIERVQVPELDRGDVLVRVKAALTCGTDVKVFRRGYHPLMNNAPALVGHELAGDICSAGALLLNSALGQRVVAHHRAPCRHGYYCAK